MIYLANDSLNQGVYVDFSDKFLRSSHERYCGLVGNGVFEVPVTVKKWRGRVEVELGRGELFCFIDEDAVRRILSEVVRSETVH